MPHWQLAELGADPAPPSGQDIKAALAIGAAFTLALIYLPSFRSASGPTFALLALACLSLAAIAIRADGWLGPTAAVATVLLSRALCRDLSPQIAPEGYLAFSPYQVDDFASGLLYIRNRMLIFLPTVLLTLALSLAHPSSRKRLTSWLRVGSWSAPIRWPLPWKGVGPVPLWLYVCAGAPMAMASLLPAANFDATSARWDSLAAGALAAIPFMALANAAAETLVYRLGIMAILSRCISPAAATLTAGLVFGAGHFNGGIPDGLFGLAMLSYGSFVVSYFILLERGFSAALVWHIAMDIFGFLFILK